MKTLRFTLADAQRAADTWKFNCGPAALCAVLGKTPDEIRPHLGDFERRGYIGPMLMYEILDRLGIKHRTNYRSDCEEWARVVFPSLGLVRIQWGGPWTNPGVPMRVRYRHTHWVACDPRGAGDVFDVNAMCVGGWCGWDEWSEQLVPWLLRECEPKASGHWWPTHCIETEVTR